MSKKTICIILCVIVSIVLPILIQSHLNYMFRGWFNPPGWIVLQPHLRIMSTFVCFLITYFPSLFLLRYGKVSYGLRIAHLFCTFIWAILVACLIYLFVTD